MTLFYQISKFQKFVVISGEKRNRDILMTKSKKNQVLDNGINTYKNIKMKC